MKPDVIILAGVSGSGKTRTRLTEYPECPYVDIAEVYKEIPWAGWYEATVAVATKVRKLAGDKPVIVEGYFLPGSASLKLLKQNISGMRADYRLLHAPKEVCMQRVIESGIDVEIRLDLIDRKWEEAYGQVAKV